MAGSAVTPKGGGTCGSKLMSMSDGAWRADACLPLEDNFYYFNAGYPTDDDAGVLWVPRINPQAPSSAARWRDSLACRRCARISIAAKFGGVSGRDRQDSAPCGARSMGDEHRRLGSVENVMSLHSTVRPFRCQALETCTVARGVVEPDSNKRA